MEHALKRPSDRYHEREAIFQEAQPMELVREMRVSGGITRFLEDKSCKPYYTGHTISSLLLMERG